MNHDLQHDILAKYFAGELSEKEEAEVLAWLEEDESNRVEFDQVSELMTKSSDLKGLFDSKEGWNEMKSRIEKDSPSRLFTIGRVAASLAVLLVSSLIYFILKIDVPGARYISANKSVVEEKLPDGTIATLNMGALLEVSSDYGDTERFVKLKGEAYFDVASSAEKVFSIDAGQATISVLGTKFSVNTTDSVIVVNVFEGTVKVESDNTSMILTQDEKIVVNSSGLLGSRLKADSNDIFWMTGDLEFDAVPLEDALLIIGSKFDRIIYLDIPNPHRCLLTTTFRDSDLTDILEIISMTYDLEITETQQIIRLTGSGCD